MSLRAEIRGLAEVVDYTRFYSDSDANVSNCSWTITPDVGPSGASVGGLPYHSIPLSPVPERNVSLLT